MPPRKKRSAAASPELLAPPSPIAALPLELMVFIWMLLPRSALSRILLVCKYWCSMASRVPSLWKDITFGPHAITNDLEVATRWLSRSESLGLTASIIRGAIRSQQLSMPTANILRVLQPATARLTQLRIALCGQVTTDVEEFLSRGTFPCLESLSLVLKRSWWTTPGPRPSEMITALGPTTATAFPRLQALHLQTTYQLFPEPFFATVQLVELVLGNSSAGTHMPLGVLKIALEAAPNLRRLGIIDLELDGMPLDTAVLHNGLTALSVREISSATFHQLATALNLPNLTELLFDCPEAEDAATIMQWLLVPENAQRLRSLHLVRFETVPDPGFFAAFTHLVSLGLDFTPLAGLSRAYWKALVGTTTPSALRDLSLIYVEPLDAQGLIMRRKMHGHAMLRELKLILPTRIGIQSGTWETYGWRAWLLKHVEKLSMIRYEQKEIYDVCRGAFTV